MDRKGWLKQVDKQVMDEQGERRNIICWQLMKESSKYAETWQTHNSACLFVFSHLILSLSDSSISSFLEPFFISYIVL